MADYAIHDTTLTGISNVIRKKEGSSALIDPADYADRINYMGMLEKKIIVSSPICDFSDGSDDVPTDFVKITMLASLTGYSSASVVNSGKNLAQEMVEWNATNRIISPVFLTSGTYTVSFQRSVTPSAIYIRKGETVHLSGDAYATKYNSTSFTFTADESTYYYVQIYRSASSTTWDDAPITNPQIERGSSASSYVPYIAPTTYSANLGRTIYGGEVDLVIGTGKNTRIKKIVRWGDLGNVTQLADVTRKEIVLPASEEAKYSMASASTDLLNDKNLPYDMTYSGNYEHIYIANSQRIWIYLPNDTDANTEISVSYTLADSLHTDFTFDGQEIPTRLGYNCFISEQGDTSVAYRASGTIYNYPRGEEASF